jgi:hypothetical protein
LLLICPPLLIGLSKRTFDRTIKAWGWGKKTQFQGNDRLNDRIASLYRENYNTQGMQEALAQEGIELSNKQLTYARLQQDKRLLFGPPRTAHALQAQEAELEECLQKKLSSGLSVEYGRTMLQATTRAEGVYGSRNQVSRITKRLDPRGVNGRANNRTIRRRYYRVKGPDAVLSADGYDKLAPWGFQIYGLIDGYSRFVRSIYCGVSNRTAVAVMKQYLTMVRTNERLPLLLRTDMGDETLLMAWAHVLLRRSNGPVRYRRAMKWGTSMRNIRIESFWSRLSTGVANNLRQFFQKLEADGNFFKNAVDITAMRFIYMPIVRANVAHYVKTWNLHKIRRQRNRPYLPSGTPLQMYNHPNTGEQMAERPNGRVLDKLDEKVASYNLDEYIPSDLFDRCSAIVSSAGFNLPVQYVDDHKEAYLVLRAELYSLQRAGLPIELLEVPTGAMDWIKARSQEVVVERDQQNERANEQVNDEDEAGYFSDYSESEDGAQLDGLG